MQSAMHQIRVALLFKFFRFSVLGGNQIRAGHGLITARAFMTRCGSNERRFTAFRIPILESSRAMHADVGGCDRNCVQFP